MGRGPRAPAPSPGSHTLRLLLLAAAFHGAGCERRAERCTTDGECRRAADRGTCEPSGYCSFPDPDCPFGRRYGRASPSELRERCVKVSVCGDGRWTAAEYCEDGNLDNDDGCTRGCVTCDESIGDLRAAMPEGTCISRHDTPLSWTAAHRTCMSLGGHLITFPSATAQAEVEAHLLGNDTARFWFGQSYDPQRRTLAWITGRKVESPRFHPEGQKSPGPGHDCATLSPGRSPEHPALRFLWSLEDCSNPRPFLCETPPWRVRTKTSHAYRVVYGRFSWDDAEAHCQQLAAHLVAITDMDEATFVAPLIDGPVWIGAHDQTEEGRWQWVTGEPFRFHSFGYNQPDNQGDQDCIAIEADMRWYDRSCANRYAALCELE